MNNLISTGQGIKHNITICSAQSIVLYNMQLMIVILLVCDMLHIGLYSEASCSSSTKLVEMHIIVMMRHLIVV